jgi:nitroreductase
MEFCKLLEKRRTIRKFLTPPTEAQLEKIFRAGAMAPSAGNRQNWFVVIINDPEMRNKIGEIKRNLNASFTPDTEEGRARLQVQKDAFQNCTTLMFYTYAPEPGDPHRYDHGSVWLFVENISLAAVEEGLGGQIFALWDEGEETVNRLLGVPEKYRQVTGFNIGVPHPDYRPPQKVYKSKSRWVFREKWPAEAS